jgi:hypothetical protein
VDGKEALGWIVVCTVDDCVSYAATSPTDDDDSIDVAEVGLAVNNSPAVVTVIAS